MRFSRLLCLLLIVTALTGCGNPQSKLAGHYKGSITGGTGPNDSGRQVANAMMPGQDLDLREDGTYTLSAMGLPIEGTWIAEADQVTLTPTKMRGVTISGKYVKPLLCKVDGEGKLAIEGPDPNNTNVWTFVKQGS